MEPAPELCRLSAVQMAKLIRTGELSARETVEAHLAHIERANPTVNAIVTLAAEQARQAALQADESQAHGQLLGPLHGLPTAHKDLQLTKGIRTTFGSRIFRDFIPDEDSPLVERIKSAGAITLGKTNTPEFGAGSQTYNEVFGATLNPWDLTKTCGGSSGGAAVSVACGMLPIADGTDLGASLRNPASFCGVVGFRPSAGAGSAPFNVEGPLARSVTDVALFLSAITGSPQPLERSFKGVRIAWWKDLGGVRLTPGCGRLRTPSGACSNGWAALWKRRSPILPAWMRRSERSGSTAPFFGSANTHGGIPGSSRTQFFGKSNRAIA